MSKNVLEQLKDGMPGFSKSNRKLAHYIIENTDEAAFSTAAQLGRNTGISESTVVRFAAKLGYKGFPQFQQALSKVLKSRLNTTSAIDIKNENLTHSKILEYVMTGDADKINYTYRNIDDKAFDEAVDTILTARKVYVVGLRSSAALAQFLVFYLRMAVKNIETVTTNSSSEMFEQMINVGEEDAVIGISFPRYSMRTLKAMEFANNRSAKVIAITDSIHSPMNLYSSCNLFARTDMATIVDSLVAPMSLINALIVAVCIRNSGTVVHNLEELDKVWEDYQITNNDEINYLDEGLMKDLKELKG